MSVGDITKDWFGEGMLSKKETSFTYVTLEEKTLLVSPD